MSIEQSLIPIVQSGEGMKPTPINIFFWTVAWSYPLMILGCALGDFSSRRLDPDFYASLGDNPLQVVNFMTGYIFANLYLLVLFVIFFWMKNQNRFHQTKA